MSAVIKVANLSKFYKLGLIGGGTLYGDLNRWWARVRGKPDPLLKIGEKDHSNRSGEYIWALRDVSFDVQQGEVLGIIGRNGAGKSTLLKIISHITAPTSGCVKIKGRIGALLEVGTGFHPELAGRENVYLNGAILGMTKAEVTRKFDEIVDFSGVEQFIDTPVKRYSSGMKVRLAFAVAAHLDPEILVIDEVLAVGDAEFQKKCLGKMGEVAHEGRTVLFVSHNMAAVQNLCANGILLEGGLLIKSGEIADVVNQYLSSGKSTVTSGHWCIPEARGDENAWLLFAEVRSAVDGQTNRVFYNDEPLTIEFGFHNGLDGQSKLGITFHLVNELGIKVLVSGSGRTIEKSFSQGAVRGICTIPGNLLHEGNYNIARLLLVKDRGTVISEYEDVLQFETALRPTQSYGWMGKKEGVIRPLLDWELFSEELDPVTYASKIIEE